MRALSIAGLALTLCGALVLAWRDIGRGRGFKTPTWRDLERGLPRREVRVGFPLIALGTLLQIIALAVHG